MSVDPEILSTAQLAAFIKALRKSQGLTQADVARMLGVSKMRVATIERDIGRVSTASTLQLLHLLGASLKLELPANPTPDDRALQSSSETKPAERPVSKSTRGGEW